MASVYSNYGPIYLPISKYNALVAAGTLETGREYRITDLVGLCIFTGAGAPTTSTAAQNVGDKYFDTTNTAYYTCNVISGSTYTWKIDVSDVQINGTTIIDEHGIGNIPNVYSASGGYGVAKVSTAYGIGSTSDGTLSINAVTDAQLVAKTDGFHPIVSTKLDNAVMEGLGNNALVWTDEYKASARATIGAASPSTIEFLGSDDT